ncbi:hypothetical protein [Staphylococcus equorum]|uniref:DUF1381 domain-containing protein n=1 Tax=Staphylococcus equorum TaxID=246432 RepID=UPI003CF065F0
MTNNNFAHDHAVPYGYEKATAQRDNKSYLIKTTTHITGEVFHDVIPIRDNEHYEIVTADTRYQALNKFKGDE